MLLNFYRSIEIDRLVTELPFKSPEINSKKEEKEQLKSNSEIKLEPIDRRPRNQTGLDSFFQKKELKNIDAIEQRKKESSSISAAQSEINSMMQSINQKIILDHRESSSTLAAYLRSMGFKVEFQHLECGDIKITEEVLIERKTSRDLLNSITDGRLLKQCHNLINNCQYPLLLIELGEVGSAVHPNAVLGAMAHITLDIGIPVMMTKNTLESAHFLSISAKRKYDIFEELKKSANEILDERDIKSKLESAKKEIEIMISDDSYQSPLLERWKIEALENKVELIYKITGLELETSRIILSHFGSIAAFMTASKKQLTEINDIDDITAEQIISSIEQL